MSGAWKVLSEKVVFEAGDRLRISMQDVELPNGRLVRDYMQLQIPDFALVLAETRPGLYVCERHYRHGPRREILSLPAGGVEPDEAPLAAAQRELLEETGYTGSGWEQIGILMLYANSGGARCHVFVARDCQQIQAPCTDDLEETMVEIMTADALADAVQSGDMPMAADGAALFLALRRLGRLHLTETDIPRAGGYSEAGAGDAL